VAPCSRYGASPHICQTPSARLLLRSEASPGGSVAREEEGEEEEEDAPSAEWTMIARINDHPAPLEYELRISLCLSTTFTQSRT